MMELKSVGMVIPNIWEIKFMFQTTNQITYQVYPDVGSKSVW
jgi:hypothetical protein